MNRQNLNVNFRIPVVNAPSRGGNFNYTLVYDSLIWRKVGNAWFPATDANGLPTWGWKDNQPFSGSTHFYRTNELCDTVPATYSLHWWNYSFTDASGTVHNFNVDFYQTATACLFNTGPKTGYATDGSGYYLDATSGSSPIVKSPSGDKIIGTRTDSNGNSVSAVLVGSETDLTDTTGRITLKIVPSGSTSKEYRILDQTGSYTNSKATATYQPFNIKTNFACGVTEYTANSVYLITQLSMPNGQSYSFTYEDTPGFSGYKTSRIKKVTLPTGGSRDHGSHQGIHLSRLANSGHARCQPQPNVPSSRSSVGAHV